MRLKARGKSFFTLIEVMIVLAIIGIIAGIGVPQFKQYQDAAYAKKRLLSIQQFIGACDAYIIQFDLVNPNQPRTGWKNSRDVFLVKDLVPANPGDPTGLGLNLDPFKETDILQTNTRYSVFDFIKGGAPSMKVGNTSFRADFPPTYLDTNRWNDMSMNIAQHGDQFFAGYNNATGMADATPD